MNGDADRSAVLGAVAAAVAAEAGEPPPRVVRSRPCAYRTSFPLDELELERQDEEREALIVKEISLSALAADARAAKPRWLFDPVREVEVYRQVLPLGELGPPRFWGARERPGGDGWWLLIERIEGPVLWQVGDAEVWGAAAAWLARSHARLRERASELAGPARLIVWDAGLLDEWIDRALAFAEDAEDSRARVERLAPIAGARRELAAVLASVPRSVIHGEFFPSNVLIARDAAGWRVAPVDWEMAGIGPALLDLAALTSGSWSSKRRRAVEQAYRAALPASDPLRAHEPTFERALCACRLALALERLGWAPPAWEPPAEHRRDWLADALEAADRLGLG